ITREGVPKVTDFGLAKVQDALALSRTGDLAGTPFYMSPEQASSRGKKIDHRTDIFSLGVTLYEMITLSLPFQGDTSHEVLKKILLHEPKDPRTLNSRIPRDLTLICLKAMEKAPEKRYARMEDFAADLHRFLSGETILARPPGMVTRAFKKAKRHPVLTAGALGLVIGLLFLTPWYLSSIHRKQIEFEGLLYTSNAGNLISENPGVALLLGMEGAGLHDNRLLTNNTLLKALASLHERRVLMHQGAVNSAVFSADGARVLTASEDGTAQLWDTATGLKLGEALQHGRGVISASFCLEGRILTVERDGPAHLWDGEAKKIIHTFGVPGEKTLSALLSPEGKRAVTVCYCFESGKWFVRIWDVRSGEGLCALEGHESLVHHLSFNVEGTKLITASRDRTARIWDAGTGKEIYRHKGHGTDVVCAAFSADGQRALTASRDCSAQVWDVQTGGEREWLLLQGHEKALTGAAFSPDESMIATASEDRTIRVWNSRTGECLWVLEGHRGAVDRIRFREDGLLASASRDGTARVWDPSTGREIAAFLGHEESVISVVFGSEDKVLTASEDGSARIWNIHGSRIPVLDHGNPIACADVDPEGALAVTVSADDSLAKVWNLETGVLLFKLAEHLNDLFAVTFSHDGSMIATGSYDNTIKIWNARTGELIRSSERFNSNDTPGYRLSFSFDDSHIFACNENRFYLAFNVATGGRADLIPPFHSETSESGRAENKALLKDAIREKLNLDGNGFEIRMNGRGSQCIVHRPDQDIAEVWDLAGYKRISVLQGHTAPICFVNYCDRDRKILTASEDGTARVWPADPVLWAETVNPYGNVAKGDRYDLEELLQEREQKILVQIKGVKDPDLEWLGSIKYPREEADWTGSFSPESDLSEPEREGVPDPIPPLFISVGREMDGKYEESLIRYTPGEEGRYSTLSVFGKKAFYGLSVSRDRNRLAYFMADERGGTALLVQDLREPWIPPRCIRKAANGDCIAWSHSGTILYYMQLNWSKGRSGSKIYAI
ncbi:MAG: protein kinase, partial [Planctomycetes bacterium]|nr:protein kinase [Planctomycetota bacterium]